MKTFLPLADLARSAAPTVGGKAATLGELLRAGFTVPDGVVAIGEPDSELVAAAEALGQPWAVRSSAVAEDLASASYAGQYETVLNVRGREALLEAIRRVRASAREQRVSAYQERQGSTVGGSVAVLIQPMVDAHAAGVAFTADPLTGEREVVVITAGRGLGERVVGGEATADEWRVRGTRAERVRDLEHSLTKRQAKTLATLCRRIEAQLGVPQDIEWAVSDGRFYVLQARPMTALPPEASWTPPSAGHWTRTFRIGEWLNEPMTPLFADWVLEEIEKGYLQGMRADVGAAVPFRHAVVNGWYYTAPPRLPPVHLVRAALVSKARVFPFVLNGLIRVGSRPELADRRLLSRLAEKWQVDVLPRYERAIAAADAGIARAAAADAIRAVEEIGSLAGEAMWSLAIVGGSAWKMESCLAKFLRLHAPQVSIDAVQALLSGLGTGDQRPSVAAHGVQTLDWFYPTVGELQSLASSVPSPPGGRDVGSAREAALEACRSALAAAPEQRARFDILVEVARRYAALREQQAGLLTLGWPTLRRCAARLGELAAAAGRIAGPEDVFFLRRSELTGSDDLRNRVSERRVEWGRQRRLVAPLSIGTPSRIFEATVDSLVHAVRTSAAKSVGALVGHPASPGRAEGPARIIRGVEDFERFAPGDVLVARGTAPAWTPLFARAAAVVTDGGSLAAHASLVAREYGIPAVVGTGAATVRLRDGQRVLVDGSAGVVEPR